MCIFGNVNVDYIIVGLGLAGLAFAEQLVKNNKTFIVFEDNSQTSSLVAIGAYNPVVLKKFTPVWNGHEQLQRALPFYLELENKFHKNFDNKFPIRKVFKSIADENNWFTALDKPTLDEYMKPKIIREKIDGVIADFGFGELTGTGRIDTRKLITTYRNHLKERKKIIFKKFDYQQIEIRESGVFYKEFTANKIVFCEGYGIKQNPFFKDLPLEEVKGELITIHAPDLNIDFLLKSSLFLLPLGDNTYKVGATFNWVDKTSKPTSEGKKELMEKLKKVINVSYTILEQTAGIRPTVKDRRPLVGVHSEYKQLAILNGLGTRGVMVAPTVAESLYNHLEKGEELDKEVNIKRFY